MDPMYSKSISFQLFGWEFSLPAGPHYYEVRTWVGDINQGTTREQAFEALRYEATPGQSVGARVDENGQQTYIFPIGTVSHTVFPEQLQIINTTLRDHWLDPGNVSRGIEQEGTGLYVVTKGYGYGILPGLNQTLAVSVWSGVDLARRAD